MPGRLRSSVYRPEPVVFSAASTMAVGLPMMERLVVGRWSLVVGGVIVVFVTREPARLCVPRLLPSGLLRTFGCSQCSGTSYCLTRYECLLLTDQDSLPAATSPL